MAKGDLGARLGDGKGLGEVLAVLGTFGAEGIAGCGVGGLASAGAGVLKLCGACPCLGGV